MEDAGKGRTTKQWWIGTPVLAAYSWWATALQPFTAPALVVTLATGLAVMVAGSCMRQRRGRPATLRPAESVWSAGLAAWGILLIGLAVWELAAFLQLPRSEHPTLSSLANSVFDSHPVRTLAFGAWVAAGFGIARR